MPGPLPAGFAQTRDALHIVAEHVIAPVRYAAEGRIGLRHTPGGFGTPLFSAPPDGTPRQIRVQGSTLLDGQRRHELTTVAAAASFLGITPGAPRAVYAPATDFTPDVALRIEPAASVALGEWFGLCTSLLQLLIADSDEKDTPSLIQIWPEHFDIAADLGPEGARANYGGSPGDADHPDPYLYVGPWEARTGSFWNEAFGASLSYRAILDGADPLAFLREGRRALAAS